MKKPFCPPANWKLLYDRVKEIRSKITAPVDEIGCDKLHDADSPQEDQRYQKLLALMLSAQTRDQCTAQAMKNLRNHGCSVQSIEKTSETILKELIKPVCFHNNKARHIKLTTCLIAKQHAGVIPSNYDELLKFPGVGPKMAYLFLQCADGKSEGIGVDVHVHRLSQRFQWVSKTAKTPEDTRRDLQAWLPSQYWSEINGVLVGFGQTVCLARNPKCKECAANTICPSAFKECKKEEQLKRKNTCSRGKKHRSE